MDRAIPNRRRREAQHLYEKAVSLRGCPELELALAPFEYPDIWDSLTSQQQNMIDIIRDEYEGFCD